MISDGVLVLSEAGAEDPSAGNWYAYDLVNGRSLWSPLPPPRRTPPWPAAGS